MPRVLAALCWLGCVTFVFSQETPVNPAATTQPTHTNRLINATSPYLLQHAHNPVDWHEWGQEALELARREKKPIFLSIGYSACHWCHVMAHESFESEEIAAVMNRLFVNIKVDREERPDLDEIYMQATMIINQGQGGWPMSVWLTPDLKPFFAGTYFPPDSRWGRPGFKDLCERIGELWETKREALESDAAKLTEMIAAGATSQPSAADAGAAFTLDAIDRTAALLSGAFDPGKGGMLSGGTNKFPPSMAMDLMLRSAARARAVPSGAQGKPSASAAASQPAARFAELVELTLDEMARGGIYDQLGGGIHRYSTDREWLVPHFEKMLYDQALVSRIYIDAWQFTKRPLYKRIACEIFDYVIADLQSPAGGFYSTRDADSEGVEGKFYVWTKPEVLEALGPQDGELFCSFYDVSDSGNWQDPHDPGTVKNILHAPREMQAVAKLNRAQPAELDKCLAAGRAQLLALRAKRAPPHRDEKILVEWNGLMIASLARGGAAFGQPKYIEAAARAAGFILKEQLENGRLKRAWRDGRRLEAAFLSDYACLIEGLLELYEATFDRKWLDQAARLNRTAIELFWDNAAGGFFFTASDHEQLIARTKDIRDSAVPSGNSVQLMNLLRLSVMLGNDELRERAEGAMRTFAADVLNQPGASERFLAAVEFALAGPVELAIVGDPASPGTQALLRVIRESYLPNRVVLNLDPARPELAPKSPLLEARTLVDGQPAAYVCRNYACKLPATTAEELARQLGVPRAP